MTLEHHVVLPALLFIVFQILGALEMSLFFTRSSHYRDYPETLLTLEGHEHSDISRQLCDPSKENEERGD